jgi:hypothetical protein
MLICLIFLLLAINPFYGFVVDGGDEPVKVVWQYEIFTEFLQLDYL